MPADTRTREDDLQLWIELDAVSLFVHNLIQEGYEEPREGREFTQIDFDASGFGDIYKRVTLQDVNDRLWRSEDDYEEFPEWKRANARSSILVARLFTFLTTPEGQEACRILANRSLTIADKFIREAEDDA